MSCVLFFFCCCQTRTTLFTFRKCWIFIMYLVSNHNLKYTQTKGRYTRAGVGLAMSDSRRESLWIIYERISVARAIDSWISVSGVRRHNNRRPHTCVQLYSRGWTWDRPLRRVEWWCSNWSACSTCSSSCSTCSWCSCLPNRPHSSTSCCTPCCSPWSPCSAPYLASPRTSECRPRTYNIYCYRCYIRI